MFSSHDLVASLLDNLLIKNIYRLPMKNITLRLKRSQKQIKSKKKMKHSKRVFVAGTLNQF